MAVTWRRADGKEDAGGPERSTRGLTLAHDAAELVTWAEGAVEGVAEAHRYAEALEAAEAESRARAAEITSAIQRHVPHSITYAPSHARPLSL